MTLDIRRGRRIALDALWRALLAGRPGMDHRVRTVMYRNLAILSLSTAAIPWTTAYLPLIYLGAAALLAGHRAYGYVRHWTFRRHVVTPTVAVLDPVIRKNSPSGQGLMSVDIPRDFRDREGADIRIGLPMDWTPDKIDMARLSTLLSQRLSTDTLTAAWTLSGRKPHVTFSLPAKPPVAVDFTAMTVTVESVSADAVVMGAGTRGQVVTFDLAMESPHLLLGAGSGAGKSELLAWLIGQFMRRGYGVLCLDAKFVSHMWLRRIPGVLYAAEAEELHDALLWLDGELLRRARFVSSGGDPGTLVPLVAVLEEMNGATNRLRTYWKQECDGKGMSPALTALANLSAMGRELLVHILMAGQSATAKASGGTESRESFGGRALARATANQWRMLAPQIRPAPLKHGKPGRWHLVVGDSLKEFQAPFCDIKREPARLIEWATGGEPVPDVPDMVWGGGGGGILRMPSSGPPTPQGIGLREWVELHHPELELTTVLRWRERRSDFPAPVGKGERGRSLYDRADLDLYALARVA